MIKAEVLFNFDTVWINDFAIFKRFDKWMVIQCDKDDVEKFDFLEQAISWCLEQ